MSGLSDALGAASAGAAAVVLAIPAGVGQDVARVLQAALGVGATLARAGKSRAEIVDAIHRVADLSPAIAAQDAAIDARLAAMPEDPELVR